MISSNWSLLSITYSKENCLQFRKLVYWFLCDKPVTRFRTNDECDKLQYIIFPSIKSITISYNSLCTVLHYFQQLCEKLKNIFRFAEMGIELMRTEEFLEQWNSFISLKTFSYTIKFFELGNKA